MAHPELSEQVSAHLDHCTQCDLIVSRLEHNQMGLLAGALARPPHDPDRAIQDRSSILEPMARYPFTARALQLEKAERALADLSVGQRLGDCRLITELGAGSFGRVFLAEHESMRRMVALKVATRRSQEPELLSSLNHPHIVKVFHYDDRTYTDDGLMLLYMQHVSGCNLRQVIQRLNEIPKSDWSGQQLLSVVNQQGFDLSARSPGDPISILQSLDWPTTVCWIGARLAHAVHYAHSIGICHRDIKPENILISSEGRPFLVDFNVSFGSMDGDVPIEQSFGGSLPYMSPEHLEAFRSGQGIDTIGEASDVYSLATVLWELLTGDHPFPWDSSHGTSVLSQQVARVNQGDPTGSVPDIAPRELDRVLKYCLSEDPAERWNGDEVVKRLHLYSQHEFRQGLFPSIPTRWRRLAIVGSYMLICQLSVPLFILMSINYQLQYTMSREGWDLANMLQHNTLGVVLCCNLLGSAIAVCYLWKPFRAIFPRRNYSIRHDDWRRHETNVSVRLDPSAGERCLFGGIFVSLVVLSGWLIAAVAMLTCHWWGHAQTVMTARHVIDFLVPHLFFALVSSVVAGLLATTALVHELYPALIPYCGRAESRRKLRLIRWFLHGSVITMGITPYIGLLIAATTLSVDPGMCITIGAIGIVGFSCALVARQFSEARLSRIWHALTPLDEVL